MKLLIFMIFSHFIGDVFLRNKIIDKYKDNFFVLIFHCFIWSATVSIPLEIYGLWTVEKFLFLFLGHIVIDFIKGKADPNKNWEVDNKPDISEYKIVDQIAHIFQLIVVASGLI